MLNQEGRVLRPWAASSYHRQWLLGQAHGLLDAFAHDTINPRGGFFELDEHGGPIRDASGSNTRAIHVTTRMIYCYSVAHLLGHPGAAAIVDHGMAYLWSAHRDAVEGGYFWSVDDKGPVDATKQAYGHAFVLLAAASAKTVGHPDADRLLADITQVLRDKFWEPQHGASAEEFSADWTPIDTYRGQNSNMHLTEALMAAHEATGDGHYLVMAESIADLLIRRITARHAWTLPEHFSENWEVNRDYAGSEMFRPAGTTPGHWLEWSRLILQLWIAGGRRHEWMPEAASALFHNAINQGWDRARGGFFYTLDFDRNPLVTDKIWWPACEGIAAASFIGANADDPFYETWYRAIWDWSAANLIDSSHAGWRPQLDADLKPKSTLFTGKPDIYHTLQAYLIPLFPATGGLLRVIGAAEQLPAGPV
ncbi:AGE family epimerase/isomerase [Lichenihabitans psoromatis]|uniref:AGE family epimerase/isomerase n=1 Tax=Lichenihabitans psoromatis TaxID=2528642 RepID=UPI00103831A0|nr:AGE family epimerase/isomerase [Lichenihabitans psoromatis]